jgi:hypothetical protein
LQSIIERFYLFIPWLALVILVFSKLFSWAKNKKTSAIVFGALIQMFMPDPYVERTIKVVQQDKKQQEKRDDVGDKKD